MLWDKIDTELLSRTAYLRSQVKATDEDIDQYRQIKDYYYGYQLKSKFWRDGEYYMTRWKEESESKYAERLESFAFLNITRHIIGKLFRLYSQRPTRELYRVDQDGEEIEIDDPFIDAMADFWDNDQLSLDLLTADHMSGLGVGTWEIVQWNDRNKLESVFWTHDDVGFVQDTENQSIITSVWTFIDRDNRERKMFQRAVSEIDTQYTPEFIKRWVDGKPTLELEHGYGVIPVQQIAYDIPWGFVRSTGIGLELMQYNKILNEKLSHLNHVGRVAAHNQPYAIDVQWKDKAPRISPLRPLDVESIPMGKGQAQLGTFNLSGDAIPRLIESIKNFLDGVYGLYGMKNKSPFSVQTGVESGIAKYLEGYDVVEFNHGPLMTRRLINERQRVELCRRVWGFHTGNPYPEDFWQQYRLNVYFDKMEPVLNLQEKALYYGDSLDRGLMTPWEILLKENPDLADEETAKERYIKNKVDSRLVEDEINRRLSDERRAAAQAAGITGQVVTNPLLGGTIEPR